jgi:hypothetical protein
MKRIINHLLNENPSKIRVIADAELMTTDQIKQYCGNENMFSVKDDSIYYTPPYDIVNRNTLIEGLKKQFPKGMRSTEIKYCYEFIESDLNELLYENRIYTEKYGKTDEDVFFWLFSTDVSCHIGHLWEKYKDVNIKIESFF